MQNHSQRSFRLNNNLEIPCIGIGASRAKVPEGRDTKKWLTTALQAGYRHIDTAEIYDTECDVALAIEDSKVSREHVFITSKLHWAKHHDIPGAIENSLTRLKTSYFDLYLLHWPQCAEYEEGNEFPRKPDGSYRLTNAYDFRTSWKVLEEAYRAGKCKAIGVSNFSVKTLEELLQVAEIVPAVNQVELHPYLAQPGLVAYCREKGIQVLAYTPGGRSVVRNDPTIADIAKAYGASATQVILAWHVQKGVAVLPKSINAERQCENLLSQLPTLQEEHIYQIDSLDRNQRISNAGEENGLVYGWSYEQLGW
ncbi:Aldo/keto reductase [Cylindrobasidium torrendii FP15055 ss-10]|uniref:Aldo/keto reductase n=1 Tax=Cylindrobasidium torrendii FP15055 ss-10 TaxID=1314674 RepID=A0A0D7B3X3_9AGAR|nr:Aldo/keto reductase [Cylindrobasidium torrendii FP15055 ss-10]